MCNLQLPCMAYLDEFCDTTYSIDTVKSVFSTRYLIVQQVKCPLYSSLTICYTHIRCYNTPSSVCRYSVCWNTTTSAHYDFKANFDLLCTLYKQHIWSSWYSHLGLFQIGHVVGIVYKVFKKYSKQASLCNIMLSSFSINIRDWLDWAFYEGSKQAWLATAVLCPNSLAW